MTRSTALFAILALLTFNSLGCSRSVTPKPRFKSTTGTFADTNGTSFINGYIATMLMFDDGSPWLLVVEPYDPVGSGFETRMSSAGDAVIVDGVSYEPIDGRVTVVYQSEMRTDRTDRDLLDLGRLKGGFGDVDFDYLHSLVETHIGG